MLSFEHLVSKRNRTLEVWLKEHDIKTYAEFVEHLQRSGTSATSVTLKRAVDLLAVTPVEEAPAIVQEQPEPEEVFYKVPTTKRKVKSPPQPTS